MEPGLRHKVKRPKEQAKPKTMEKYQRARVRKGGGQQKEQRPEVRIQKSGTA